MVIVKKGKNQYVLGWTESELDYIIKYLGVIPIEDMAIKLNRTVTAIESKIEKMKISIQSVQMDKNSVSLNLLSQILQTDAKAIKRWVKKYKFPMYELKLKKTSTRGHSYINVDDFWLWAKHHQEVINWAKLERRTLLPEPEWLERAIQESIQKSTKPKKWTKQEDVLIWSMYYHDGLQMKVIAAKQGRSVVSIEKRLKKLRESGFAKEMMYHAPKIMPIIEHTKSSKSPLKKWTVEEEERLIFLYYHCNWSQKTLALEFQRTENAIERKLSYLRKNSRVSEEQIQQRQINHWTDIEINQLLELKYVKQQNIPTIAKKFPNRTKNAIENKLRELAKLQTVG